MQVRDVLRDKGARVVVIAPTTTLSDAIAKLVQNNIGSLPVTDEEGRLLGMLSERDILRANHQRGVAFGTITVAEVMTRNPTTCDLADDVNLVMGKMSEGRIAKVPVLHGDQLVGIISVGDVIKVLYASAASENSHLMSYIHGSY